MKRFVIPAIAGVMLTLAAAPAGAVTCAAGVFRAGCVGPNGAFVARRPYYGSGYYGRPGVVCGAGPYRAGCIGPNGAAVVRRRYW